MKIVALLLVTMLILCFPISGFANENKQTTSNDILFANLLWGTSPDEAITAIESLFPETNSVERTTYPCKNTISDFVYTSYNFTDPKRILTQYIESPIRTEVIVFEHRSETLGYSLSLGKVAGYNVSSITMKFLLDEDWGMYSAQYSFSLNSGTDIRVVDQHADLLNKLKDLYGIPYTYEIETSYPWKGLKKYAVWKGENNSGVYLDLTAYTSGYMADYMGITLNYGSTSVTEMFQKAAEEYKEQEIIDYQELLDIVLEDKTGL